MDRYGLFLCYLNRDNTIEERKENNLSYNEKMLKKGYAIPYFIWPNIDPFMGNESIVDSVPDIANFQHEIKKSKRLEEARESVKNARESKAGISDSTNPLILHPFEMRNLTRRST